MDKTPNKFPLESMDVAEAKRQQLKQLFPEAFTEARDAKTGELKHAVDWEKLRASLGEVLEREGERFGLSWPGKSALLKVIQQPSVGTLKPCREESVKFDETKNLFIEGDNLEVLKLLQKSYFGKVKMIYIDPPYNTGNEFVYPDNFTETLETYLQYSGMVDAQGRKFATNATTEGRFHSKWLNMMYPRLFLARNLLKEDGAVFISIDDNEVNNLRGLCDEIFGEECLAAQIIWKRRNTPPNDKILGTQHEYILVYVKETFEGLNLRKRSVDQIARYKNPDNHPKGVWVAGDLSANVKGGRYVESLNFPIKNPRSGKESYPPKNGNWRFNRVRIEKLIENDEIYFGKNDDSSPKLKRFLCDVKEGTTWTTLWDFAPHNTKGSAEISELIGNSVIFENPKPSGLIKDVIKLGGSEDALVLDFFSGSGSTAHAVLDLNREDGGSRKFIMVQLPEPCDEKSEAFKAGYATIANIGKDRIRRVIQKFNQEQDGQLNFDSKDKLQDLGFKVFKLSESNFKTWQGDEDDPAKLQEQLEMHVNHVNPSSTPEDILYELLLKAGFPLTTKVEKISISDKSAYSIAEGALIICLDDDLTKEAIQAITTLKPVQCICLDAAFHENDQLKTNAVQTMESAKVQFRTV
jgi:adenine-specific DNA-methyltransferase